jgi:transcriptional regulator with XRE-family HTH domain
MELIKDRIAHIIRAKNLTATQFAEMMQIQPSNVSHLLSGRNKPSLDFLIKLKDVFPEYSFDWIILGKKPITLSERPQSVKEELHNNASSPMVETSSNFGDLFGVTEKSEQDAINTITETKIEQSKQVKQIVYIYDDNTFEIYHLNK